MTIYLDRDSGTYFTQPPIEIATTGWDQFDHDVFSDFMTDEHRCQYAEHVTEATDYRKPPMRRTPLLTPAEWYSQMLGKYRCQLCDTTDSNADIQGNVCAACFEAMPVGEWVSR